MKIRKFLRMMTGGFLVISASLLLGSCTHKNLYYEEPETTRIFRVIFDWKNAPDANPSSMVIYFYNKDGSTPIRFIFDNKVGGTVKLPYGEYTAICKNSDDTDWAQTRNDFDEESFEVFSCESEESEFELLKYSPSRAPQPNKLTDETGDNKGRDYGDEKSNKKEPGMLWSARHDGFSLSSADTIKSITLYPSEIICHYTVDIYNVENLKNLKSGRIAANLTNMADGVSLKSQSPSTLRSSSTFYLRKGKKPNSLHAEFLTFGEDEGSMPLHKLKLVLRTTDGNNVIKSADVTSQIRNAEDPKHVHIIIRGLKLPASQTPQKGGGFKADVDDWQTEYVDMRM